MDLSKVVQYDEAFPVEIKHRITGEPVGLTIYVSSFEGEDAMRAERRVAGQRMQQHYLAQQSGKSSADVNLADLQNDADREKAIDAVKGWEWADGLLWNGSAPPDCDDAGKREVLLHPNAGWILAQVINAGKSIENFTGPSVTSA